MLRSLTRPHIAVMSAVRPANESTIDPMPPTGEEKRARSPRATAAMSGHFDTLTAARQVAESLATTLFAPCDLLLLFGSFHHRAALGDAATIIRERLDGPIALGVTAESVIANATELEGVSGISALALSLPGVGIHSFRISQRDLSPSPTPRLPPGLAAGMVPSLPSQLAPSLAWLNEPDAPRRARELFGVTADHRATILFADPFTMPMDALLRALGPTEGFPAVNVIGGFASGAGAPSNNVLLLDDLADDAGAIGVSLSGPVRIDPLVSQGCRPIGSPVIVTRRVHNTIFELGGRPALEVVEEMASRLPESERALLGKGVMLGLVVNEYKARFGRGDFLIRTIVQGDRKSGTITLNDEPRVGQTVQFHVRDQRTADEDLRLLLDAEELDTPPLAVMLFACNGRGTRLFDEANHDAALIHRRLNEAPTAGFFAAGEFGPIGGRSALHGQTLVAGIVRAEQS